MKSIVFGSALLFSLSAGGAWAQGAGPTDPEIAAIVVTANQVDIDAGKVAKANGYNKDVRAFGERMASDHAGVNKSAKELVEKLHVTPKPSATSESLEKGGEENRANLKKLSTHAFDKAYIDHEVTYHEQVLEALDKTLIPSAQNPELKALLVKTRPAFVAHLERAKEVQAEVDKEIAKEPKEMPKKKG